MKIGPEYHIQSACVEYFKLKYPDYMMFSVPTEATYKNKYYFQGLGSMAGVSDTIIMLPGHILFVEFKAPKGKQSEDQKLFEEKAKNLGFEYFIIRSLDEFIALIETIIKEKQA